MTVRQLNTKGVSMGRHQGPMRKGEVLFWLFVAVVAVMIVIPFLFGMVE